MNAKLDLITFEQALRSTGRESIDAYGEHVNPVEAHLLRLMGIDRRYTRAEGMYLHDDREEAASTSPPAMGRSLSATIRRRCSKRSGKPRRCPPSC